MLYFAWFLVTFLNTLQAQDTTTVPSPEENNTLIPQNISESNTQIFEQNDPDDEEDETLLPDRVAHPEIIIDSASGITIPHGPKIRNKFYHKHVPVDVFQKLSPVNWLRPVQEKWTKIKELLAYTKHPNYGGVQFLGPQEIWERLHEKGHDFLTGINGAIFGLSKLDNYDYPFAYRELKRSRRSTVKEILINYKETRPFTFKYGVNHEKLGQANKSYKFPYMADRISVPTV